MAWSNVGAVVTLEPGETAYWSYSWPGNADKGVQIAGANTGPFASPAALGTAIAFDQGKVVEGINQASYVVSIRNSDPSSMLRHNLSGGGVS